MLLEMTGFVVYCGHGNIIVGGVKRYININLL